MNRSALLAAAALAMAATAPWYASDHLLLLTHVLIVGLFALSLDLVLGVSGIVSLGHAAFFGIGAYAAGLFAKHVLPDPTLGLLASAVVSGLAGLLCSPLVVRGNDLSRLMVTLGVSLLLYKGANRLGTLTGGADGLQGISMGLLLGLWNFDMFGRTGYLYVLVVTVLLVAGVLRLLHSEFGVSLRAIHDQPRRAAAMGIDVDGRLASNYTLAGALAGAAGALMAQTTQFVGLEVFGFSKCAEILVVLIVGGVGVRWGGFVGAAIYLVLHEQLSALAPQYWNFWLGLFLIALVLFLPNGALGGWLSLRRRLGTSEVNVPMEVKP
jgi:branched-chain amino acid transport system permease protein